MFILNSFCILENVSGHPAADRMLLNVISYASRDTGVPLSELRPDLESRIAALGFDDVQ